MDKIFKFFKKIVCKIKSFYYTRYKTSGNGSIIFKNYNKKLSINLDENAQFILNGNLIFNNYIDNNSVSVIHLDKNSCLRIDGDFIIGPGVTIKLNENAALEIGGKSRLDASGITSNTLIMVKRKIKIGYDFICSWNVFITDSDWHQIEGVNMTIPVFIGNKVWIANNCNVLKGAVIGNGSILACNTKVSNKSYPENSLIAGERGKIIKEDVKWNR